MLAIEIIEGCNFKCYFCKAKDVDRTVFMDLDLFKRIILEAKEMGIDKLKLTPGRGEPFLHPDIYEMLDFVSLHMKEALLFTNATAINVSKLKQINMSKIILGVSQYGITPEKFNELTAMDEKLFDKFNRRIQEMRDAGIVFDMHRRDEGYVFDWAESPAPDAFNFNVKCQYHQQPKIFYNGDITFCNFARENMPTSKSIFYMNLNTVSLREALESPLRWKFFDTQSICAKHCSSFDRSCYNEHTIVSLKLLNKAKKNYETSTTVVDQQYLEIENEIIQSTKQ